MLRCAPMACLGGRSPYEVVTGLKPRFPRSILGGVPGEERSVDSYVKDLMEHLKEVHSSVQRTALETIERDEASMAGHLSQELEVGDPVLVRREATAVREGPSRLWWRTWWTRTTCRSSTSRSMQNAWSGWTCRSWGWSRGNRAAWRCGSRRLTLGMYIALNDLARMGACVFSLMRAVLRRANGLT